MQEVATQANARPTLPRSGHMAAGPLPAGVCPWDGLILGGWVHVGLWHALAQWHGMAWGMASVHGISHHFASIQTAILQHVALSMEHAGMYRMLQAGTQIAQNTRA